MLTKKALNHIEFDENNIPKHYCGQEPDMFRLWLKKFKWEIFKML